MNLFNTIAKTIDEMVEELIEDGVIFGKVEEVSKTEDGDIFIKIGYIHPNGEEWEFTNTIEA